MTNKSYSYAIYLLSRQEYSIQKLKKKLTDKGYTPEEIQETIQKVIDQNYLSEERYQRLFIKKRLLKNLSNFFIQQQGRLEGLSITTEDINSIRNEYQSSESEDIQHLIQKKMKMRVIPEDRELFEKLKAKVLRFIISKGHNPQEAIRAFHKYIKPESFLD